jgi:hypothetical protein
MIVVTMPAAPSRIFAKGAKPAEGTAQETARETARARKPTVLDAVPASA